MPSQHAVVHVVQTVQDAQVRDARLVRDDLRRRDGAAKRSGVHGGEARAGEPPRGVDRILVTLRVERDVAPAPVAGSPRSSSWCRA